ncbi:MAG TPA: sigma-70 family RNA polymerase sigma factor [Kofleriaceae bacterium]|nr:sigma-70 family RNA polymerase sigma factor [Kofleriaceae bacterium]
MAEEIEVPEGQTVDDFALLDAWCRGNRSAGSALIERHYAGVARFFGNKVSEAMKEDLIQETFLACTKSAMRFRGQAQFRIFLDAIARNVLVSYQKRLSRSETRLGLEADLEETQAVCFGPSPIATAARHEEQQLLLEALQRIPLTHQVVLGLHYWGDLSVVEIGEVLGVPLGTAKTRLRSGRSYLQDHLRDLARSPGARPTTPGGLDAWVQHMRAQIPESSDDGVPPSES